MAYVAMTPAEEAENLRETVIMLNDRSERLKDWQGKNWSYNDAEQLRRMVRAWIAGGRSLWKVHRGKHRFRRRSVFESKDLQRLEKFTQRIAVTTESNGRLLVVDFYGQDTAAMHFARLIRNSQQWRLREPCRTCEEWFLSKTKTEKHPFCSRKCAGSAAQKAKRGREHRKLLRKAQDAIEKYPTRPARFAEMNWKHYVSEVTGISKKFLTLAIRRKEVFFTLEKTTSR